MISWICERLEHTLYGYYLSRGWSVCLCGKTVGKYGQIVGFTWGQKH